MSETETSERCSGFAQRLIDMFGGALARIELKFGTTDEDAVGEDVKLMTGFAKLLETLWGLEQKMVSKDETAPDRQAARSALMERIAKLVPRTCDDAPDGAAAR